ncbi:MAG: DNA translocase FtsK [Pseudomonadota bacterium]|nr:DNA translocase FtsK [Pseudomonadota bacterium]
MFDEHDGRPDPSAPAPESSASDSERYIVALDLVVRHQKASVSWLQRQMQIGYNAASRLIERLEREGTISKPDHVGRRDVLLTEDQADAAVIAAHVTNQLKDVTMTVVPGNAQ